MDPRNWFSQEVTHAHQPKISIHALRAYPECVSTMLLTTKLYSPPRTTARRQQPPRIPRPHLISRLRTGLHARLTLVSAPPGFGKTTLVADWVYSDPFPTVNAQFCWLSLDEGDNDPVRFFSYVIAALQTVLPKLGAAAVALLQSLPPPMPEAVLTLIINELTDIPHSIILVLDDYHVIITPAIHSAVTFLVDHMPSTLHLVITSRADPLLPLARWRARREMAELRTADLRFTPEEAALFLNTAMGLNLAAPDLAALEERTEGWIAALQLAALSLQGRNDRSDFVASFAGSNHYITDYLVDEVLEQLPPVTREFLLQTALLDSLCGSLCDAVTGQNNGQAMLEQLERANLFLVPLDDERRWYRYHHLFADVLRSRVQQIHPEQLSEWHRRASVWYEEHEFFPEAINEAWRAVDMAQFARLIEQHGPAIAFRGQIQTVLAWLDRLPEDLMRTSPVLYVYHASVLMFMNRAVAAEKRLQDAERAIVAGVSAEEAQIVRGQVATIRANLSRITGDMASCIAFAQQALAYLPEVETAPLKLRAIAMLDHARAYRLTGTVTPADEALAAAMLEPVAATGNTFAGLNSVTNLAYLQRLQGRLRQARRTYAQALQLVSKPQEIEFLFGNGYYYFGLGDILREQNDLEGAQRYLAQGFAQVTGEITVEAEVITLGYTALAWLQQAQGTPDVANATLIDLLDLARQRGFAPHLILRAEAVQAHLRLTQGNLAVAQSWAREQHPDRNHVETAYLRETETLVLARVLLAGGRAPEAERLLARLLLAAEAANRGNSVIEILIIQALALHARQNTPGALIVLQRALDLAEPEGYVRIFLNEGPLMALLLRHAQPQSGYAGRLLDAFSARELASLVPFAQIESISARELDVLRLMAQGASNQTIADTLVVALPTVKKHVSNILGKLQVASRTQAIAQAHQLGLL
jgi:LuxR family transcriptional regulator, maltose regulon positive regulatory protein